MKRFARIALALLAAIDAAGHPASANGIAGDRLFPSTMTVEDTHDDDEVALPTIFYLKRGANGETPAGRDLDITAEFSRSLTADLTGSIGTGRQWLKTQSETRTGWDNLDLTLKYRTILNEPNELLVSTGVIYGIGGTGAARVGAERFDTVEPLVTFGKGLGDLPHTLDWLRPLAVTGAAGFSVPTGAGAKEVHYGLTLQYSLVYLDQHVDGSRVPAWAARLIPLIEFSAQSPFERSYGTRTIGTISPGATWNSDQYQFTVEALLPLNRASGSGVGIVAQIHVYLDDIFPKPLFSFSSEQED